MVGRGLHRDYMGIIRPRLLESQMNPIEGHDDPDNLPWFSRNLGIMKAIDLVPSYLHGRLGSREISLSYVIL